jgi:hypothetical protein
MTRIRPLLHKKIKLFITYDIAPGPSKLLNYEENFPQFSTMALKENCFENNADPDPAELPQRFEQNLFTVIRIP